MTIELSASDRAIIAALQAKVADVRARAESSISAYQDALSTAFAAILKAGGGGEGNYQLNAAGTALVAVERPGE